MRRIRHLGVAVALLVLAATACQGSGSLDKQQAIDIAWEALEPNTSSHSRANWETGEVRRVKGLEVSEGFEGRTGYGCPGPTPPANSEIQPSRTYWYVQMVRRPATPPPKETPISPTAPPNVPEPFIQQGVFLIDPSDGQVVARKLFCVIY